MGGLLTILVIAVVIWAGIGVLTTLALAEDDAQHSGSDIHWIEWLLMLGMNMALGPFSLLLLAFVTWSSKEARERQERWQQADRRMQERERAKSRRAARERYIRRRDWRTTNPEELRLLEAEYQRLVDQDTEQRHRPEAEILKQLRREAQRSPVERQRQRRRTATRTRREESPTAQLSYHPPRRSWREERPEFWRSDD